MLPTTESLDGYYPIKAGDDTQLYDRQRQANLDPRHRDRLAYIRIVSGKFEKGMKVSHSRMKGRQVSLTQAQQLFAQDRESVMTAYPGTQDSSNLTCITTYRI